MRWQFYSHVFKFMFWFLLFQVPKCSLSVPPPACVCDSCCVSTLIFCAGLQCDCPHCLHCINYFQLIYVAHLSPTDWPAICAKIVLFFSLSSCVMFAQVLPNLSFTSSCLPSLLFPVGFCLFYIIQTAVKTFHVILSLLHCAYESPANVNPKFAVAFLVVHLCKSSTKNSTRPV